MNSMRNGFQSLFLVTFLLLSVKGFSQNKSYIKITYVSCFSTFETWITESAYGSIEGKDSIMIYEKNNITDLIKLFKFSKNEGLTKIDYRVKIEIFKKHRCKNTYFFDNKGFYYHNGIIYKSEKQLLNAIKKLAPNIDCWN
jgi:hypothetical protein